MPSPTPIDTNSPRRATPRVAAQTIEMISAASSTSRKTSRATPGIWSLDDQPPFGGVLVEVAKKAIAAGAQGTDEDRDCAVGWNDLLAIEIRALELFRRGVLIAHGDLEFRSSPYLKLARSVHMVFEHQLVLRQVVGQGRDRQRQQGSGVNNSAALQGK